MTEYLVRFLIAGAAVSIFAILGDILRPKSFAELFGAAPSVALASLGLAVFHHGGSYASVQGRTMACGAVALLCYSFLVCQLLMRARWHALTATLVCAIAWLIIALALGFATGQLA
jgi:hypothetical protein